MATLWETIIKAISNAGNGGMQGMGECGMSDFTANLYLGNTGIVGNEANWGLTNRERDGIIDLSELGNNT